MPGGDGTGPAGFGPMTGRAAGYCAGCQVPGYANPSTPRGYWGRGRGGGWERGRWTYGRGWRRWPIQHLAWPSVPGPSPVFPYASSPPDTVSPENEVAALKTRTAAMKQTLDELRRRINELTPKAARA